MDIYRLKEDITFSEQIGATLSVQERLKLQLGFIRLTQLVAADQLLFWGRVETLTKPYYIVMAVDYKQHYEFPHKKFFWSQEDNGFAELPPILEQHKDKINSLNLTPLSGNPSNILVNVTSSQEAQEQRKQTQQQAVQQQSDSQKEKKEQPKNLTELDRLSVIVKAIENECHAVPIGAHRINEQHQLRQNIGFQGLTLNESKQLKNYHLFRAPQTQQKRLIISQADSIFKTDFLDKIDGSRFWSLQFDCSKRDVTLRNLIWPGYISYHRADTNIFGGIYFGNGIKKADLAFFL